VSGAAHERTREAGPTRASWHIATKVDGTAVVLADPDRAVTAVVFGEKAADPFRAVFVPSAHAERERPDDRRASRRALVEDMAP